MFCGRPTRRFSRRVFRVFALSLLVVSTVFTGTFFYAQKRRMEADLLERGRTLAALLASGARTAVYSENAALVQDGLQGVLEHREVLAGAVFTGERTLLAAAGRSPALREQATELTAAERALLGAEPCAGCASLPEPGRIEVLCPVLLRSRPGGGAALFLDDATAPPREEVIGYVKLTLDRGPLARDLAALLLRSLLLAAAMLVVGTGGVFLLARRVTGPLERLTEAVRAYGAGSGMPEPPPAGDDEIGRLAEAFATMIREREERERERERLDERLRHAQKMEAVGMLSQGISHDFKNILSTLAAALHVLRKGSAGNEFVLGYARRMEGTVDRARELVERLVSFSRTRRREMRPVDLTALLRRVAAALRESDGDAVRLDLEAPAAAVTVAGDVTALEQLLMNLAYNARDAMPGGGVLGVRLEATAGAAAGAPGEALLTVRDTGCGMEPEVRRRLFEPFFTTKEIGTGMGLGLSIVHGIVEEHRGRIEVESEPGAGATFRIRLPLAAEAGSGSGPGKTAGGEG